MKLEETEKIIRSAVSPPNDPVLLLSGGIDSVVTLFLIRQLKKSVPVIIFAADFSQEQQQNIENLIFNWDLTAYIYPPKHRYFVPNGEGLSLVDEYGLEDLTIPVVRDLENGDKCGIRLNEQRNSGFGLGWNTVLTGILAEDAHPVMGKMATSVVSGYGRINFVAPLFEWTKAEVSSFAEKHELTKLIVDGTGEIRACTACLDPAQEKVFCPFEQKEIPIVQWEPNKMLSAFQQKFGFQGV